MEGTIKIHAMIAISCINLLSFLQLYNFIHDLARLKQNLKM